MLIYFLASSGEKMTNIDLNFDSRYYIKYNPSNPSIEIEKNSNYLQEYWGSNISGLTSIIGGNGVGKTSITRIITDRFLVGLTHNEHTVMILQKDNKHNEFDLFYNENLFNEHYININGQEYRIEDESIESQKNKVVLKELGIVLDIKKIPNLNRIDTEESLKIRMNTRIGKNNSLFYYTNVWNYSKRDRLIDKEMNAKELDYYDYSIGNRLDNTIRANYEFTPPIADVSDINEIHIDDRFKIDYLFKLQQQDMVNALSYLNNKENYKLLSNYFKPPEEIYIYYDFMDSDMRKSFFTPDEAYLRFENREKNYKYEDDIYNYLLNKSKDIVKLKEALGLTILERLFKDMDRMIISDNIKKRLLNTSNVEYLKIKDYNCIFVALKKIKQTTIDAIEIEEVGEVFKEKDKSKLKNKVGKLMKSYSDFLKYILNEFCEVVDVKSEEISIAEKNQISTTKLIKVEVPIIKLTEQGIKIALEFFEEYSKLYSNSTPLYFSWRGLSSGETLLMTLLTSLNTAIESSENNNLIVLLDEADNSLHPMWQKNYIKLLVENINAKAKIENKKVQLIITTHSPFILSDLPLNSTILLEKNKEDQVILKNELEHQITTLGANIHELYSHSFFLKNGLIGDHVRDKINKTARLLVKDNEPTNNRKVLEEIKVFINQIGEPIIKQRLLELYEQMHKLNEPLQIQDTQKEIKELKRRLEYLEQKGDGN